MSLSIQKHTHARKVRLCHYKHTERSVRFVRKRRVMTKRCYTSLSILLHLLLQLSSLPPSFISSHQGRATLQMKHCSTFLLSTPHACTHTHKHTRRLINARCCNSLPAVTSLIRHTVHCDIINKSQDADSPLMAL